MHETVLGGRDKAQASPHATTRRLMIAIAFVALLIGTERLLKRRAHFLGQAEAHAMRGYDYGEGRGFIFPREEWYDGDKNNEEWWGWCDKIRRRRRAVVIKDRLAA